jgi:hypothetical protein
MKAIDARARTQVKNILFETDLFPAAAAAIPYVKGVSRPHS